MFVQDSVLKAEKQIMLITVSIVISINRKGKIGNRIAAVI